jgi:hypothetical protein
MSPMWPIVQNTAIHPIHLWIFNMVNFIYFFVTFFERKWVNEFDFEKGNESCMHMYITKEDLWSSCRMCPIGKKVREIMHGIKGEGTNVHGLTCQWVWTNWDINYVTGSNDHMHDAIDVDSLLLYACKQLKLYNIMLKDYWYYSLIIMMMVEVLGN